MVLIPDGRKLTDQLFSQGLISLAFKDDIMSTLTLSRSDIVSRIFHEIEKMLDHQSSNPKSVLRRFCLALKRLESQQVTKIADELLKCFDLPG